MPEFIKQLNVFCLIAETMQKFTEVMESGIKSTDPFVIIFWISSLFTKLTKRRSAAADHMNWVFVMLFVDASIYQGTERICLIAGRIQ